MKKLSFLHRFILVNFFLLFCTHCTVYATHIIGGDLTYAHITGTIDSYKITLTLYGDCGPVSLPAFEGLPVSQPQICLYNGPTFIASYNLDYPDPQCGSETTPLCSGAVSQCTTLTSAILGVKKFEYTLTVWIPSASSVWRFVYTGNNGTTGGSYSCTGSLSGVTTSGPVASGRTASITNLVAPSSTYLQLIDTLNNTLGPNSSPIMNIPPLPYFPAGIVDNYYPDAVDPDGDSLNFYLVDATDGTEACGTAGGSVTYLSGLSGANPLQIAGTLLFNNYTGLMTFDPNVVQRSTVVYNVREFRSGTLVGTSQREMNFLVLDADSSTSGTPCFGIPFAGITSVATGCAGVADTLKLTGVFPGCGITVQWQYSADGLTWTNIPGATSATYPTAPSVPDFYRCAVSCAFSGLVGYSNVVFMPLSSGGILHNVVATPLDTFCNGPVFYVSACGVFADYNVTIFYGDGTWNNTALTTTPLCYANITHSYAAPGSYYISEVLYSGTTPVDTIGFTYEYMYCRTLPVKFYYDANMDCVFDSGDSYCFLPVLTEVDSNGIPIDTVSAVSGFYYKAYGGPGTVYTFRIISAPAGFYASCPTSGILYDTISSAVTDYPSLYFAFNCSSSTAFDLAEYAFFRAGPYEGAATMIVDNSYCTPESATYTMTFSPKYVYVSAYPPPASVAGNMITWNIDTVSAIKPPCVFNASFYKASPVDLTVGDTVTSSYLVMPVIGDVDTTNNSSSSVDTVQAAYDPNSMTVNPSGIIPEGQLLQYTITFENTGNAAAKNIHIMDTLSPYVDFKSIKVVAASAAMQIAEFNDGLNNIVKFDFPGINLPDSSHHNQGDGMIIFDVNALTGLPNGTNIFNHAGIFFDDNVPVLTDTVENIICTGICGPDLVRNIHSQSIELYPNPANNSLTIRNDYNAYNSYTVTNTIGEVILPQQHLSSGQTKVNITSFSPGLYYITFKGDNGSKVMKFVKMQL